jgi:hypothetical protein
MTVVLLCTGCQNPFKSDGSSMICPDCVVQQQIDAERQENRRLSGMVRQYEDWLTKYKVQNSGLRNQVSAQSEVITKLNKELEGKR